MKRFVYPGLLFLIVVWGGSSSAMDCRLGAEYYYRAKFATNRQQRIEWLQHSTDVCPNFNAWYMLGLICKDQGQPDQALNAFTQARAKAGSIENEALALGRKGETRLQTGHLAQALRELELAKRFHPAPAPDWLEKALKDARIQFFRSIIAAADIALFLDAARYMSKNGRFAVRPAVNLPVHFDFDQANLNSKGNRQLLELGRALSNSKIKPSSFLLVGHTDKRGTREYNQILSEKRAHTVKIKLERHFPSLIGQLRVQGRGEMDLLYEGDNETDHMLNRRVKVSLNP